MEKETKILPCKLTNRELHEVSQILAEQVGLKREIELEKKTVDAGFNERIKAYDVKIVEVAKIVRDKSEQREVECVWKAGEREDSLVRTDTSEVIEVREHDSQETLDFPEDEDQQVETSFENPATGPNYEELPEEEPDDYPEAPDPC